MENQKKNLIIFIIYNLIILGLYDEISRLVIQADINISSVNSGGALLNAKGHLIGITTFRTKSVFELSKIISWLVK